MNTPTKAVVGTLLLLVGGGAAGVMIALMVICSNTECFGTGGGLTAFPSLIAVVGICLFLVGLAMLVDAWGGRPRRPRGGPGANAYSR